MLQSQLQPLCFFRSRPPCHRHSTLLQHILLSLNRLGQSSYTSKPSAGGEGIVKVTEEVDSDRQCQSRQSGACGRPTIKSRRSRPQLQGFGVQTVTADATSRAFTRCCRLVIQWRQDRGTKRPRLLTPVPSVSNRSRNPPEQEAPVFSHALPLHHATTITSPRASNLSLPHPLWQQQQQQQQLLHHQDPLPLPLPAPPRPPPQRLLSLPASAPTQSQLLSRTISLPSPAARSPPMVLTRAPSPLSDQDAGVHLRQHSWGRVSGDESAPAADTDAGVREPVGGVLEWRLWFFAQRRSRQRLWA